MRLPDSWKTARVTMAIAVVTAAAWLIVALFGLDQWAVIAAGFWPARLDHAAAAMLVPLWLTPLTATLVHAGLIHILFNLIILVYCGRPVESVVGPAGIVILYVLGAYAAAGGQYLMDPLAAAPMVGASGAISAILGAYAILFGRNKVKIANPTLALWLNALWLMVAWVGLQICMGIVMAGPDFLMSGDGVQIAVGAHIGGFLVGLLLANPLLLFRYRKA